jgi:hypothetical protein
MFWRDGLWIECVRDPENSWEFEIVSASGSCSPFLTADKTTQLHLNDLMIVIEFA